MSEVNTEFTEVITGERTIPVTPQEQLALPVGEREVQYFIGNVTSASVSSVTTETGDEIAFVFPRPFVPSFDASVADNELIFSWSNKDEENVTEKIAIKGKIYRDSGVVELTGEGFKSITIKYESNTGK